MDLGVMLLQTLADHGCRHTTDATIRDCDENRSD